MLAIFINYILNKVCIKDISLLFIFIILLSGCASKNVKPVIVLAQNTEVNKPKLSADDLSKYTQVQALMESKKFSRASQLLKSLLARYPKLAGAHVNLAIISQSLGNDKEAKEYYLKALAINPNNTDALIQLAGYSQKEGFFKEVERYLLTAEAVDQSNSTVQYNLAILYELYLQNYDEAIQYYKRYVALASGNKLNNDVEIVKRWIILLERK